MSSKSSTLFHFTGDIAFLKNILSGGFWPRYCFEDHNWRSFDYPAQAYPIVCFCDIPLSRVTSHCVTYGNYGIGVSRNWAKRFNLNPVVYIETGSRLCNGLNSLFREHGQGTFYDGSGNTMYQEILPFLKPTSSDEGETLYTLENEWRYVPNNPKIKPFLKASHYKNPNQLQSAQSSTLPYRLDIKTEEIQYIFISVESERREMIEHIRDTFAAQVSNEDIDALISRIISMEQITSDF